MIGQFLGTLLTGLKKTIAIYWSLREHPDHSGNLINRQVSIFYIEAVPQLFFQLQKIFFTNFFFDEQKSEISNFSKMKNPLVNKIFSFMKISNIFGNFEILYFFQKKTNLKKYIF